MNKSALHASGQRRIGDELAAGVLHGRTMPMKQNTGHCRVETTNVVQWPEPPKTACQLNLFTTTEDIDIEALRKSLAEMQHQQRAVNTLRAYKADWKTFTSFCLSTGREILPAEPKTVMLYLAYEASKGRAIATITRRLAAITAQHESIGHATPCNPDVGLVLSDIRRKLGAAARPKSPISADQLRGMLRQTGSGVRGALYRAVLVLGFASGCRRSELSALNIADVTSEPQGLAIRIARSKTDQEGKGRELGVQRGSRLTTCPVHAIEKWLKVRGSGPGPLFCRVVHGKATELRLEPAAIARVVKRMARLAGMNPEQYAGHSLRSGCATAAAGAGADILAIARRLGHASTRTTEKYVRHGSLFAANPLENVL